MSMRVVILFVVISTVLGAQAEAGQKPCTPGELRTDSTPTCISIEWDLTGDSDHDATCGVKYREKGAADWKEALALFRVDYKWWYHTEEAERPFNMFAGSILFLRPATEYDVRLDLADPEGGRATKTLTIATRPLPELPKGGRTLHVAPGSGGGSGSADDPFRGLAASQKAAEPGDVFVDFSPVDGCVWWVLDAQPDLVLFDLDHGQNDVVADDDTLAFLSGNYQHCLPPVIMQRMKSYGGTTASVQAAQNGQALRRFRSGNPNKVSCGQGMSIPVPGS